MRQSELEALFADWEAPMVRSCIQGCMGSITIWKEASVLAAIGDFCFLAGEPVPELIEQAAAPILVPGHTGWSDLIVDTLGGQAVPFTRYATRRMPETFDRHKLFSFTKAVPKGFMITPIDKEMYITLLEREWSRDLCGCFVDESDFLRQGLGFVVIQGGLPVAGAASYAVCEGGIEIEIDTHPDFRRLGLAAACGAKLILESLKRGVYPNWDAHDSRSLALAEKLGYQLDYPYAAYWVEEKVRYRRNPGIN